MRSALRKLTLTAHVVTSVGWLGAVAGFLVLSIAGGTSHDPEAVRGAYLSMNLIGQCIIVPLGLAALVTGIVQSLGTHWGLFRHVWVLTKLLLTIGATVLLLLHQFTAVATAARRVMAAGVGTMPDVGRIGAQLVGDAGFAVLVLLVTTTLSVYKPWGRTRYGRRKRDEERRAQQCVPESSFSLAGMPVSTPLSLSDPDDETNGGGQSVAMKMFLAFIGIIAAGFIVWHLASGGLTHHMM